MTEKRRFKLFILNSLIAFIEVHVLREFVVPGFLSFRDLLVFLTQGLSELFIEIEILLLAGSAIVALISTTIAVGMISAVSRSVEPGSRSVVILSSILSFLILFAALWVIRVKVLGPT